MYKNSKGTIFTLLSSYFSNILKGFQYVDHSSLRTQILGSVDRGLRNVKRWCNMVEGRSDEREGGWTLLSVGFP